MDARTAKIDLGDEVVESRQGARLADALVQLVTGGAPADRLVIHVQDGVAETPGGGLLDPETVIRIAGEGRVHVMGDLDRGRGSRWVPKELREAVLHRDGYRCTMPGCGNRVRSWLVAHHIVHWSDGGPTDMANLTTLCKPHHNLIHDGKWRLTGVPGRDLTFRRPDGRVYEVGMREPTRGSPISRR